MRVHSLHVYPIKGCQGVELQTMHIELLGPALDRRLMLVDERWRFVTQRTDPKLATVSVGLGDRQLIMTSPHIGRLLQIQLPYPPEGRFRDVTIWKDEVGSVDLGEEASLWFSRVLGRKVRLVRIASPRNSKGTSVHGGDVETGFADAYPILLTSVESLVWLNDRLLDRGRALVGMDRFRPNIVVEGLEPFDEESFGQLSVGDVRLLVVSRCSRCPVITTDQKTGEVDSDDEPRATLREFHSFPSKGPAFGMNVDHLTMGTIHVGDQIALIERVVR